MSEKDRAVIDRDLRNVPVPPGFIARLKRISEGPQASAPESGELSGDVPEVNQAASERSLDEMLRDVAVPETLAQDVLARLATGREAEVDGGDGAALAGGQSPGGSRPTRAEVGEVAEVAGVGVGESATAWTDARLDRALRGVAVPPQLLAAIESQLDDQQVDSALADVAVPDTLIPQIKTQVSAVSPRRRRYWVEARVWAVVAVTAAALVVLVIRPWNWGGPSVPDRLVITQPETPAPELPRPDRVVQGTPGTDLEQDQVPELPAENDPAAQGDGLLAVGPERPADVAPPEVSPEVEFPQVDQRPLLGHPSVAGALPPELDLPSLLGGSQAFMVGVGDDIDVLLQHHTYPFSSPQSLDQQTLQLPVHLGTDSYRLVRAELDQGRSVRPLLIRTEDFLAANDYPADLGAPPAEGALELRVTGGPSVFRRRGPGGEPLAHLLEVSIVAGDVAKRAAGPTHVTVLLDTSASMRQYGRLARSIEALVQFVRHLGEDDRFSLVDGGSGELLLDAVVAGRPSSEAIERTLQGISAGSGTEFYGGLQRALKQLREESQRRRQLVVVSDGLAKVAPDLLAATTRLFAEAPMVQGETLLFDLDLNLRMEPSQQWQHFAEAAGASLQRISDHRQLSAELIARLTHRPAILGTAVKLSLKLNPKAVRQYRLLGHEPRELPAGGDVEIQLHAGEQATLLAELIFDPNSQENQVGEVALRWVDVAKQPQTRSQVISRLQFVPTFDQMTPSLQLNAIVAETAELLRKSYYSEGRFVSSDHGFARVLEQAQRVPDGLRSHPSFAKWQLFLEQLVQLERSRRLFH